MKFEFVPENDRARLIIRDVLEEYAPHSEPAQKDMVTEALLIRLADLFKEPSIPVIEPKAVKDWLEKNWR